PRSCTTKDSPQPISCPPASATHPATPKACASAVPHGNIISPRTRSLNCRSCSTTSTLAPRSAMFLARAAPPDRRRRWPHHRVSTCFLRAIRDFHLSFPASYQVTASQEISIIPIKNEWRPIPTGANGCPWIRFGAILEHSTIPPFFFATVPFVQYPPPPPPA